MTRSSSWIPLAAVNLILLVFLIASFGPRGADARPRPQRRAADNSSTICDFFSGDYDLFLASDVYDCLVSVPFNDTIALEFLQYYRDTLDLQTTHAYLKDPPTDYQQPPVDLLGRLDQIKDKVNAKAYNNEYDFEFELQQLLLSTHDAHLQLVFGILSVFYFGSPYGLVSVSSNGLELPKAFIIDDLIEAQFDDANWLPSAVVEINGVETTQFLETFAKQQAFGGIEPNADWNSLMSSAVSDVQGTLSVFEGSAIFYPGANITFTFENGTIEEDLPWLAQFSTFADPEDSPLIQTGQQFYDWFVLGVDSTPSADDYSGSDAASTTAATTAAATTAAATTTAADTTATIDPSDSSDSDDPDDSDDSDESDDTGSSSSWDSLAFPPDPIVAQPDLGDVNGGVVTGYILNDKVTGVLSIPSFVSNSENAVSFTTTVQDFIAKIKAANCTRVIIDVQRNTGGDDLLATDTFKQFFPTIDPFGGSRLRAQSTVDALGNTFTNYYDNTDPAKMDPPYEVLSAKDWTATDYLNAATGQNFTSFGEFFGPNPDHGDLFTTVQRENLSSVIYDEGAGDIVVFGFGNRTTTAAPPFAAKDVIILSDSFCSSACARFVEKMHHEGGARTIVAGGQPMLGPMQTVGGSRGARQYDAFTLDADIDQAITFNASVASSLPTGRDDVDFIYTYAAFNLKDAIRKENPSGPPLQFTYEAADCRIFYTNQTIYNYINLWNYVIDAFYRNPSLCIGSPSLSNPLPAATALATSLPAAVPTAVGALALSGLNHAKRDDGTGAFATTPLIPSTNKLDAPFDLTACHKCSGTDVCFQSPSCGLNGKITTQPTCATKCNNAANTQCRDRDPRFPVCHQSSAKKSGFCISKTANNAIRQCQTPVKANAALETKPPNPDLANFSSRSAYKYGTSRPGKR